MKNQAPWFCGSYLAQHDVSGVGVLLRLAAKALCGKGRAARARMIAGVTALRPLCASHQVIMYALPEQAMTRLTLSAFLAMLRILLNQHGLETAFRDSKRRGRVLVHEQALLAS